jgi:hypothetical protein
MEKPRLYYSFPLRLWRADNRLGQRQAWFIFWTAFFLLSACAPPPQAHPLAHETAMVVLVTTPAPTQAASSLGSRPIEQVPVTGLLPTSTYPPGSSAGYTSKEISPGVPAFAGMALYCNEEGRFCLWLPCDWYSFDLPGEGVQVLFSPYPADPYTGISAAKSTLKTKVSKADLPRLRDEFLQGIQALPGVEIETRSESLEGSLAILEARFTFLDGEVRRKRWVKTVYLGSSRLILTAQGRTPEDFKYCLPIFFNIMLNVNL